MIITSNYKLELLLRHSVDLFLQQLLVTTFNLLFSIFFIFFIFFKQEAFSYLRPWLFGGWGFAFFFWFIHLVEFLEF